MSEAHATAPAAAPDPTQAAGAAPAAAPAPAPADWRSSLSEEQRGLDFVKNSEGVGSIVDQMKELQAYQGNSVRVPSEHASAEERAEARDKLQRHFPELIAADLTDAEEQRRLKRQMGMPEEPTGYRRPEFDAPPGLDMSLVDGFTSAAHQAGLTQSEYESVLNPMLQSQAEKVMAAEAERKAGVEALITKEWGFARDQKLAAANVAAKIFRDKGNDLPDDLSMLGPKALAAFADIGEMLGGEGSSLQGDQGHGADAPMTPAEAQARRLEILNNKKHPYWSLERDAAHDAAKAEMGRLTKMMMGPEGSKPHLRNTNVDSS